MGKKKQKAFKPFGEKQQKEYERTARLQYGPTLVNESIQRWEGYSKKERERIMNEGRDIYLDLVEALEAEASPYSAEVQALLERWHQHIRYFYEPTLDILRGLGTLYNSDPAFIANIGKFHPDLPAYLEMGIHQYVDDLETVELQRMLNDASERSA